MIRGLAVRILAPLLKDLRSLTCALTVVAMRRIDFGLRICEIDSGLKSVDCGAGFGYGTVVGIPRCRGKGKCASFLSWKWLRSPRRFGGIRLASKWLTQSAHSRRYSMSSSDKSSKKHSGSRSKLRSSSLTSFIIFTVSSHLVVFGVACAGTGKTAASGRAPHWPSWPSVVASPLGIKVLMCAKAYPTGR